MRIVTWNVNGLRAAPRKGFLPWLGASRADVVLLQEVRALPTDLPAELCAPHQHCAHWHAAERRGYSGVGILSRKEPDEVRHGLGSKRFDVEGRALTARFGRLAVISAYFPKGRDEARLAYKLDFYAAMLKHVKALRKEGLEVVLGGDYNTAHTEIDLARPKENVRNTGFLPEERAWLDRYRKAGLIDAFRALHPEAAGHYTWWRQTGDLRKKNVGWRIDYHWVDETLRGRLKRAAIHPDVLGSDHCPVSIEIAGV